VVSTAASVFTLTLILVLLDVGCCVPLDDL
jgi:hypothetical protein